MLSKGNFMRFETCDRRTALSFLKKFYPSRQIEDVEGNAKEILDLVVQDLFRIPNPDFHKDIIQGPKWKEDKADECLKVIKEFHNRK